MRAFIIALSCGLASGLLSRGIWENLPPWGVLAIGVLTAGVALWGFTRFRSHPPKDGTKEFRQTIKADGNVSTDAIKASGEEVKVIQKIKSKKNVNAGPIDIK